MPLDDLYVRLGVIAHRDRLFLEKLAEGIVRLSLAQVMDEAECHLGQRALAIRGGQALVRDEPFGAVVFYLNLLDQSFLQIQHP